MEGKRRVTDDDESARKLPGNLQLSVQEVNRITGIIVDSAIKVHTTLGPGLLESIYRACLAEELTSRGLSVRMEVPMPVYYNGRKLEAGYRADMLVNSLVIVEIKAIDAITPVHQAQVLTYLKLSGKRVGLLLNFHVAAMKDGIRRYIHDPAVEVTNIEGPDRHAVQLP